MCTNDNPKSNTTNKTKTEKNAKTSKNNSDKEKVSSILKPSADYSSLFNYDANICLTTSEIAKATGLPNTSVTNFEKTNNGFCKYEVKLPNGSLMKYNFATVNYGENHNMQKEIKNLEKDKEYKKKYFGMFTEISETGDTYLVHSRLRSEIKIMNTNYKVIVLTSYGSVQEKLTKEQKNIRDKYATKIANYLLHKHKK